MIISKLASIWKTICIISKFEVWNVWQKVNLENEKDGDKKVQRKTISKFIKSKDDNKQVQKNEMNGNRHSQRMRWMTKNKFKD